MECTVNPQTEPKGQLIIYADTKRLGGARAGLPLTVQRRKEGACHALIGNVGVYDFMEQLRNSSAWDRCVKYGHPVVPVLRGEWVTVPLTLAYVLYKSWSDIWRPHASNT